MSLLALGTVASILLPACEGDGNNGIRFSNNPGNDAARIVADVDGVVGDPGDGGRKPDGGVVPSDAGDGAPARDGGRDAGGPGPKDGSSDGDVTPMCDLVKQDCPGTQACYPVASGVTACAPAGSLAEGGPSCGEDEQCERGLLCGAEHGDLATCLPICHPTLLRCETNIPCVAISGFSPVGYCQL